MKSFLLAAGLACLCGAANIPTRSDAEALKDANRLIEEVAQGGQLTPKQTAALLKQWDKLSDDGKRTLVELLDTANKLGAIPRADWVEKEELVGSYMKTIRADAAKLEGMGDVGRDALDAAVGALAPPGPPAPPGDPVPIDFNLGNQDQANANKDFWSAMAEALPENSKAQANYAQALLQNGDARGAADAATRATSLDPANSGAFTTLSKADYQTGDYRGASDAAGRALALDPNDAGAYSVLKLVGGRDAPSKPLEKGLDSQKSRAFPAMAVKGGAVRGSDRLESDRLAREAERYRAAGDEAGALAKAERALRFDPTNVGALYERALVRLREKNLLEALKDIDQALKFDPDNPKLLVARSNILNRLKRYGEALEIAESILRRDPKNAEAFFNKAWALGGLGRKKDALQALSYAARLNPDYAGNYRDALALPEDVGLVGLFDGSLGPAPASPRNPEAAGKPWSPREALLFAGAALVVLGVLGRRRSRSAKG